MNGIGPGAIVNLMNRQSRNFTNFMGVTSAIGAFNTGFLKSNSTNPIAQLTRKAWQIAQDNKFIREVEMPLVENFMKAQQDDLKKVMSILSDEPKVDTIA